VLIRHHTSYQRLRCISPAFPRLLPHRDQPTTRTMKPDITPQKSANLRAVARMLFPCQQIRVFSKNFVEEIFGIIHLLAHFHELLAA
jgi:hypothetical protein